MGLINYLKNIRKRGVKDIANPAKWKAVIEGSQIKKEGLLLEYDQIIPFAEQLVYRMSMCPQCIQAGECVHCHCAMPIAMMTPSASCSQMVWDKMMKNMELRFPMNVYNFGDIQGTDGVLEFSFPFEGDPDQIHYVAGACGSCTKVWQNEGENVIRGTLTVANAGTFVRTST